MNTGNVKTILVKFGKNLVVVLLSAALAWLQANYVGLVNGLVANGTIAGTLIVILRTAWSAYDAYKA